MNKMHDHLMSSFAVLLLALFFQCTQDSGTYTTEIIDDVKKVHNLSPKWGEEPKISLEFVQQIGSLETPDENFQLHMPIDVARDSYDNLYVADWGNDRIQKYRRDGEYITTIGSTGHGPGEFERPVTIAIDAEDNLYVSATNNSYLVHFFGPEGIYKRTHRVEKSAYEFELTSDRNFIVKELKSVYHDIERASLLWVVEPSGNILYKLGRPKNFVNPNFNLIGNSQLFTTDNEGNIYLTWRAQNKIEKYDGDGNLVLTYDRVKNYSESDSFEPQLFTWKDGSRHTDDRFYNVISQSIEADHKNRVWILTTERQQTATERRLKIYPDEIFHFEVFDSNGVFLTRVDVENIEYNFRIRIIDDSVFVINRHDQMAVYEYRIAEK